MKTIIDKVFKIPCNCGHNLLFTPEHCPICVLENRVKELEGLLEIACGWGEHLEGNSKAVIEIRAALAKKEKL